jgi:hypothetical protein
MMRVRPKQLAVCLVGAIMAVASLAIADVVILNPGEIRGQVSFSAETVTSYHVSASSPDNLNASGTFTSNPYSLTVESGHSYRPGVTAYFSNPTANFSSLQVSRTGTVPVNNQNGPTTVDFNYPSTRRINCSLQVIGGAISSYDVSASASTGTESYSAYSYKAFSSPLPTSATSWQVMVPHSQVSMGGTVYLAMANGTMVQRSLSMQTVNVLNGDANVSWVIDLTNTGTLAGDIELTSGTAISYHYVHFTGVYNTNTYGISGSSYVAANGAYSIPLLPGAYDVFVRTYFTSSGYADSVGSRVTISAGAASTQNFIETLGIGQVPLVVGGFFTNANLYSSRMGLLREGSGSNATASQSMLTNGQYVFPLPSGEWKRQYVNLVLNDMSNPQLPLNLQLRRQHYNDSSVLPVTVSAGTTANLGTEEVTLVKSNAYLDVQETSPEDPEILLSSPRINLVRNGENGDGSLKTYWWIDAYGASEPRSMSALALAAEPGTYTLNAYATVNGSVTQFAPQSITFGQPVPTPTGTNVSVTPIAREDLQVNLTFSNVTNSGVTTVVETPIGPEAPEGFKAHCPQGETPEEIPCPPVYYDIKTTALFDQNQGVVVCVRQKKVGANGIGEFLRLFHYKENEPDPALRWEELPSPPPPMQRTVDCGDPDNQAACGCAEPGCGIDYSAEPPESVIMVCGVTTSFSPFTLLTGPREFTNTVNGITYTGPNGPPSPQTWTVPATGSYRITATGARGAAASQATVPGGCGARMSGRFTLQGGDTLQILVGQAGTSAPNSGGGGGGSFVVLNGAPLLIAGGGGGVRAGAVVPGRHGTTQPNGVAGSVSSSYSSGFIAGGTGGSGGTKASSYGSGGGGWSGNGASDGSYGEGGFSFLQGGRGGDGKSCGAPAHGGYGGGGAGNGCYGGGGGGGYSGGGGGRVAGGGGSWNAGVARQDEEGDCTSSGHGRVTIEFIGQ